MEDRTIGGCRIQPVRQREPRVELEAVLLDMKQCIEDARHETDTVEGASRLAIRLGGLHQRTRVLADKMTTERAALAAGNRNMVLTDRLT